MISVNILIAAGICSSTSLLQADRYATGKSTIFRIMALTATGRLDIEDFASFAARWLKDDYIYSALLKMVSGCLFRCPET